MLRRIRRISERTSLTVRKTYGELLEDKEESRTKDIGAGVIAAGLFAGFALLVATDPSIMMRLDNDYPRMVLSRSMDIAKEKKKIIIDDRCTIRECRKRMYAALERLESIPCSINGFENWREATGSYAGKVTVSDAPGCGPSENGHVTVCAGNNDWEMMLMLVEGTFRGIVLPESQAHLFQLQSNEHAKLVLGKAAVIGLIEDYQKAERNFSFEERRDAPNMTALRREVVEQIVDIRIEDRRSEGN